MPGLTQLPGSSAPCTACCAVPRPFGSAPWAAVSLCWSGVAVTQPARIGKQQHCEDSGMAEGSAVPPRICFSLTLAARCSAATRASAAVMLLVLRESQRGHGDMGLQEGTAGTELHLFSIFGQGLGLLHSSWCTRTCFPLTHTHRAMEELPPAWACTAAEPCACKSPKSMAWNSKGIRICNPIKSTGKG